MLDLLIALGIYAAGTAAYTYAVARWGPLWAKDYLFAWPVASVILALSEFFGFFEALGRRHRFRRLR